MKQWWRITNEFWQHSILKQVGTPCCCDAKVCCDEWICRWPHPLGKRHLLQTHNGRRCHIYELFWPEYTIRLFGSLAEIFWLHYREGPLLFSSLLDLLDHQILFYLYESNVVWITALPCPPGLNSEWYLSYLYCCLSNTPHNHHHPLLLWSLSICCHPLFLLRSQGKWDFDVCPFIGAAIKSKKWGDLHLYSACLVESITIATAQHGPQWLAGENLVYLKRLNGRKRANWFAGVYPLGTGFHVCYDRSRLQPIDLRKQIV